MSSSCRQADSLATGDEEYVMKTALSKCPVCDGELTVTRLHCNSCDTSIEGRFANGVFAGLTPEQLDFIETFVRCEGKITRMEEEMALSYPTIRNRLQEVIRALGYEPGKEETIEISDEKRLSVLEELNTGKISADEAMRLLNGEE
jgi:hypothetical protein